MEQGKINSTILIKRKVDGEPGPPKNLKHGELAFDETGFTLYYQISSTKSIINEQ